MSVDTHPTRGESLSRFNIFVVLLIPLVWTFEGAAIGPALGSIAQAFPAATDLQVKLVMTMPFMTAIIFSAISGIVAQYIDRKTILIAGLLIYGVTGILPAWLSNINQILLLRLLTGIGVGLVSPIPNSIITECFVGEPQRRLLSMTVSIAMVANVVASVVSGVLLAYGWNYPFYTFGIIFVIALFVLVGIPRSTPQIYASRAERKRLPRSSFLLFGFMSINCAIQAIVTTTIAIFMISQHIGQPWMIGIIISLPGLACFLVSPIYPELRKLLRTLTIPLSFLLYAIGYYILSQVETIIGVSVGALIIGLGNAILTPHILVMTSERISAAQRDAAFGVVTAGIGAGLILSPFLQSLATMIGGSDAPRFVYEVAAVTACILAAATLIIVQTVRARRT